MKLIIEAQQVSDKERAFTLSLNDKPHSISTTKLSLINNIIEELNNTRLPEEKKISFNDLVIANRKLSLSMSKEIKNKLSSLLFKMPILEISKELSLSDSTVREYIKSLKGQTAYEKHKLFDKEFNKLKVLISTDPNTIKQFLSGAPFYLSDSRLKKYTISLDILLKCAFPDISLEDAKTRIRLLLPNETYPDYSYEFDMNNFKVLSDYSSGAILGIKYKTLNYAGKVNSHDMARFITLIPHDIQRKLLEDMSNSSSTTPELVSKIISTETNYPEIKKQILSGKIHISESFNIKDIDQLIKVIKEYPHPHDTIPKPPAYICMLLGIVTDLESEGKTPENIAIQLNCPIELITLAKKEIDYIYKSRYQDAISRTRFEPTILRISQLLSEGKTSSEIHQLMKFKKTTSLPSYMKVINNRGGFKEILYNKKLELSLMENKT